MASYIRSDLEFNLQQIRDTEAHTAKQPPTLLPDVEAPRRLPTMDGCCNNS